MFAFSTVVLLMLVCLQHLPALHMHACAPCARARCCGSTLKYVFTGMLWPTHAGICMLMHVQQCICRKSPPRAVCCHAVTCRRAMCPPSGKQSAPHCRAHDFCFVNPCMVSNQVVGRSVTPLALMILCPSPSQSCMDGSWQPAKTTSEGADMGASHFLGF